MIGATCQRRHVKLILGGADAFSGPPRTAGDRPRHTLQASTLHADIDATVGLDLDAAGEVHDNAAPAVDYASHERRKRDPGFRERVLRDARITSLARWVMQKVRAVAV